jgi:hypothetical protein
MNMARGSKYQAARLVGCILELVRCIEGGWDRTITAMECKYRRRAENRGRGRIVVM